MERARSDWKHQVFFGKVTWPWCLHSRNSALLSGSTIPWQSHVWQFWAKTSLICPFGMAIKWLDTEQTDFCCYKTCLWLTKSRAQKRNWLARRTLPTDKCAKAIWQLAQFQSWAATMDRLPNSSININTLKQPKGQTDKEWRADQSNFIKKGHERQRLKRLTQKYICSQSHNNPAQ